MTYSINNWFISKQSRRNDGMAGSQVLADIWTHWREELY